jgi:hypothetical protein
MKMKLMKFGEMKQGQHFQEANGRRKFIKLQTVLASGLTQTNGRMVHDSKDRFLDYNAIDYGGCGGKCPDWLEFELIEMT